MANRSSHKLAPAPALSRARSRMLALEPRYVFDAALAATLDHAADTHHHEGLEPAAHAVDVKALASAAQSLAKDSVDRPASSPEAGAGDARATDLSRVIENHNRAASTKEFVFIDSRLDDIETLVGDIPGDATIVLVDQSKDGVAQMLSALKGTSGVSAIHILSHGSEGHIELGSSSIDEQSMETVYRSALASLRANLSADADILVYGCNFSAGTGGEAAAQLLAQLTGADVATSTDVTGGAAGADWNLESTTGTIEERAIVALDWNHELLDINANDGSDSTYKNTAMNGDLSGQASAVNPTVPVTFTAQTFATAHGTVTIQANGHYTYTPSPGYLGTDSFTFEVSATDPNDNVTQYATAVETITISPNPGYVIHANDETDTVNYERPFNGTVVDNVTPSALGGPITTYTNTSTPAHGTLEFHPDGTFTYTPDAGFSGQDSFTFSANDANPESAAASAVVTFNVSPPPLTAYSYDSYAVDGAPITVTPPVYEADGSATLSYTPGTSPNGILTSNGDGTFTFVPTSGFHGDTFATYTVTDSNGYVSSSTIYFHYSASGVAPLYADPDTYTIRQGDTAYQGLSYWETNTNAVAPVYTLHMDTSPAHGTISNFDPATGSYQYIADPGYLGPDSFAFTVYDQYGQSASSTETINIVPPDMTVDASVKFAAIGASVPGNLGGETHESAGNTTEVFYIGGTKVVTNATIPTAHGIVTITDGATGAYTWQPNPGFSGVEVINWSVRNYWGAGANEYYETEVSTDTIVSPNKIYAGHRGYTIPENTTKTGTVTSFSGSPNGSPSYTPTFGAAHGSATVNADGSYSYTPDTGYHGLDKFGYKVSNGLGNTATGYVTIYIAGPLTPGDQIPVAAAIPDRVNVDAQTAINVDVSTAFSDADGDTLTFVADGLPPGLSMDASGHITGTIDRSASQGGAFADGKYDITIFADDGKGGVTQQTFTWTVTNPAPDAVDDGTSTPYNTPVVVDLLANDSDPDGDPLTVISATVPAAQGTVAFDGTNWVFTPANGFSGTATISYTISDGEGGTDTAVHTVVVANAVPDAVDDGTTTPYNTPVTVNLLANDTDPNGDTLTVTSATVPASQGTVAFNGTDWVFAPKNGFSGTATITYAISDGHGGTDTAVHTVTVGNAVPDAVDDVTSTPYNTPVIVDLLANDTDPNGDPLTVTGAFVHPLEGHVFFDGANWVFEPRPGFHGPATIFYQISDGKGGYDTAVHRVNVGNAAPDAVDDGTTTPYNTPVTVDLLANDTDPNGDPLTVTSATVPAAQGTVAFDGTKWVFTPANGFSGTATITYAISDGLGGTDTAVHTVTVDNAVPDAVDDGTTTPYNTPVTVALLANDTDPNGDPLTVTSATVPAAQGTVAFDGTKWVFTPANGFSGTATISYEISDGKGGTDTAVHTVTVAKPAIAAVNDTYTTPYNTPLNGNAATGDTYAAGSTFAATSAPAHGSVIMNANGTYTYTPAAGYFGTDTFTYRITDPTGQVVTATEIITIKPPLIKAVGDTYRTPYNTPVSANAAHGDTYLPGSTFKVVTPPSSGTVVMKADGSYSYRPAKNFAGTVTFTYKVTDPYGQTATAVETIIIAPPKLVATSHAYLATFDKAFTSSAAKGNTYPVGSVFSVSKAPSTGTVTMRPDGTYTYVPPKGFTGTTSFTYRIKDPTGNIVTATETITISPRSVIEACVTTFGNFAGLLKPR